MLAHEAPRYKPDQKQHQHHHKLKRERAVGLFGALGSLPPQLTAFDDESLALLSPSALLYDTFSVVERPALDQPTVPVWAFPLSATIRVANLIWSFLSTLFVALALQTVDIVFVLLNLISPHRRDGEVIPPAFSPTLPPSVFKYPFAWLLCVVARFVTLPDLLQPFSVWHGVGHDGKFSPSFEAPRVSDGYSRCPCPAINALANHGILPRDGRHVTPAQIVAACYRTYNLSPTLAVQLMSAFVPIFSDRAWIDLEDLSAPGLVQHDGSFTREDINSPFAFGTISATQSKPARRLLDRYFPDTAMRHRYTWKNHSAILAHRRQDSREHNGQFLMSPLQYLFSSGNSAVVHEVIGGDLRVLRPWLGANETGWEQIVDGFQPNCRQAWGGSIFQMQFWMILIELGAGSLSGKRMATYRDTVDAYDGWVAVKGETNAVVGDM